jgi:hypothetical protein
MNSAESAESPSSATESRFTTDEAYEILSYKRRRYAVHYLKQVDEPISVQELAEQVAAWEHDKPIEALDSQERKRVYVSLYQSHLSTLDEVGVVEYDDDRGEVALSETTREADIYLEVVSERNIPWGYFYLGLTVAFAVLLGLVYFDVSMFSEVSMLALSVLTIGAFGVAALVQSVKQTRAKLGDEGPPPELKKTEESE